MADSTEDANLIEYRYGKRAHGCITGWALNRMVSVPMYRAIPGWRSYLAANGDERIVKRARERLKTRRPAGDAEFVQKLEGIMGRRLGALPRGRPRKDRAAR